MALITMYRAGSTFTGEIFNQNPDVFYHFEPLILFGGEQVEMYTNISIINTDNKFDWA